MTKLTVTSLQGFSDDQENSIHVRLAAGPDVPLSEAIAAVEALLRGTARAEIGGPANEAPDNSPAQEEAAPRRRRASAEPAQAEVSRDTTTAQEGAGRTRQRTRTETPAEAAPAATDEASPRRRRATAPVEASNLSPITDADLSKACSDAAAIITPELVLDIMKEDHGVEVSGDIPKTIVDGVDQRQKFLDTLANEVKLTKAAQ